MEVVKRNGDCIRGATRDGLVERSLIAWLSAMAADSGMDL